MAYEDAVAAFTSGVEADLHLPQPVKDFSIEQFLQSLGYTVQTAGGDSMASPPSKAGRRRLVAWMPPHKR
jgi:hypothetical protein